MTHNESSFVHSKVEWPGFKHGVHCVQCQNLNSSSFGNAHCNIPIVIT